MFIITGGGSGIGKALALALAKRNKLVLIIGRHEETLKEVVRGNPLINYMVADVSNAISRKSIVERLQSVTAIEGLIHNAAKLGPLTPILNLSLNDLRESFATNLEGPFFLTKALLKKFTPKTRVLHVSSGAAYIAVPGCSAYCMTKASLSMLTKCMQVELPDTHVASVMPGIVDTDMAGLIRLYDYMDPRRKHFYQQLKENNGLIKPEVVATFFCWLLLEISGKEFMSQEWDIYDTTHHSHWLRYPQVVPALP